MVLERVMAHPLGLPGCGVQQTLWRYHNFVKQYAPFTSETRLYTLSYPPDDGSPRSTLFRTYGIELTGVPETATWDELWWPAVGEVARIVCFLVTVGIGAARLVRRFRAPALAVLLAIVILLGIVGITLVLDPRYVLAFSPAIYLAEPYTGKIVPIGFGVLSESQLIERITTVTAPGADAYAPSITRRVNLQ